MFITPSTVVWTTSCDFADSIVTSCAVVVCCKWDVVSTAIVPDGLCRRLSTDEEEEAARDFLISLIS